MARKSFTVCAEPGCPELTDGSFCAAHQRAARAVRDVRRPNATDRGYDFRWRRTRGRYLKAHPTCEVGGCAEPADDVHHLDGLGPLGPAGHKWANLEALCKSHHSRRTATEQRPGSAAWRRSAAGVGGYP